jgi:hypothetical protein
VGQCVQGIGERCRHVLALSIWHRRAFGIGATMQGIQRLTRMPDGATRLLLALPWVTNRFRMGNLNITIEEARAKTRGPHA